jgi:predicted Zn-dependent peptidase
MVECAINNGFVHETVATSGVNHLLEHVLTEAWAECGKSCSDYWGHKGVTMNASTDDTTLKYYTEGLETHLRDMVTYIVAITQHPFFKKKTIEKEKKAVINELLTFGDDPTSAVDHAFNQAFYVLDGLKHMDDWKLQIKNLKHLHMAELKQIYAEHYNPKNTLFVVSGNFNSAQAKALFAANLRPKPLGVVRTPNCFSYVAQTIHIPRSAPTSYLVFGFPSNLAIHDPDYAFVAPVVNMFNSVLFDVLRTQNGLIYNTDVENTTNVCGTQICISIYVHDRHLRQCHDELLKQVTLYSTTEFSPQRIEAAKTQAVVLQNNEMQNADFYIDQYIHQMDSPTPVLLTPQEQLHKIQSMDGPKSLAVFKRLFVLANVLCVYQGKTKVL